MVSYDKALEYFGGASLQADIWYKKYALRNEKNEVIEATPDDTHRRHAKEFARIEKAKFKNPLSEEEIYQLFRKFKYLIPQGGPQFGIGNPYQIISLSNCYVLSTPADSYAGILSTDEELIQISKRRGGVGLDISNLRPAGATTRNSSLSSTGIIPFMERYSNSIREVGQNNRRGALMITLNVHHPQILDFVKVKNDLTKVTGANISVRLTNEFLNAVKSDGDYELRFPIENPTFVQKVSAREVWAQIIKNAHAMAEPGLLFWDTIIKESPADCYKDFGFGTKSTNPCAELPLCELDSCRLFVQNLLSYVKYPFTHLAHFDFGLFNEHSKIMQRLMDDMVDLELEKIKEIIKKIKSDPEHEEIKNRELTLWKKIYKKCEEGRRTGSGLNAVGDTLAALNIPYDYEQAINFVEMVYEQFKISCYTSSVEMAEELGPFKHFNWELEKECPFIKRLPEDLKARMAKSGRRNIALLTQAPVGTIANLALVQEELNLHGTTSGIEPAFMLEHIRRRKIEDDRKPDFVDKTGDKWQEYTVYHPAVQLWKENAKQNNLLKECPWRCAEDINWVNRVKLQAAAQRHIDHAISSTINLPEDVSVDEVAKIYETAWEAGCKGITVYRKNCRTGVLVENKKENDFIIHNNAPKRPKELSCKTFHVSVKGSKYFVVVGFLHEGETPYEVFCGENNVDFGSSDGIIVKAARGKYELWDSTKQTLVCDNLSAKCSPSEEALARMISCALRHGSSIDFIVHQLEKTKDELSSFAKSIARVLKRLIKDGVKVSGTECPDCGGELFRQEGCMTCKVCGWSKCS